MANKFMGVAHSDDECTLGGAQLTLKDGWKGIAHNLDGGYGHRQHKR